MTNIDKTLTQLIESHSHDYRWALKIIFNSLGYSCVFLPGILIYKYVEKIKYIDRSGEMLTDHSSLEKKYYYTPNRLSFSANRTGILPQLIQLCFSGARSLELPQTYNEPSKQTSTTKNAMDNVYELGKCFVGLMASFLVWGLLQEKIITQPYESTLANGEKVIEHFRDSQFLVFTNRTLAFFVAFTTLCVKYRLSRNAAAPITSTQIWGAAPLFKYSFASFSNIMSAWFQYEALKYVNFPTQVLAKSCKIIPVMLMGKIISRARFELYEYLTAILISLGMLAFLLGSKSDHHLLSSINSLTGIMLLVMYLVFDSFTSNWQSDLFKTYKMSSIQMMCSVNLFSSLFTAISLAIQGGFMESFIFALTVNHTKFIELSRLPKSN